jgi:hypothetical protein
MMLGNFGFNQADCVSDYITMNATRVLSCEVGTLNTLTYAGIIPNNLPIDSEEMYYGYCNDPNPTEKPATEYVSAGITQCSTLLNQEIFDFFSNNCTGKTGCTINAASFVM